MTAPSPSRRSTRGPREATAWGTAVELATGSLLLGLAALAGLAFVHRPWANRLDVWGYRVFPVNVDSHAAHDLVTLGSLTALVIGVIAVFLIGLVRGDWLRAVACAVAPLLAVLIVQDLAKPLVGRHLGVAGGSSYPSGTVAAVASLATAVVLVMPSLIRPLAAIAGAVATAGTCVAVTVLRWHYPTDALGGIAVGVGAVLTFDALLHIPWLIVRWLRPVPVERRPVPRRSPSLV